MTKQQPKANQPESTQHYPDLSDSEREEAEKEGVKEAIKKSAETAFLTRSETEGETVGDRWPGKSEIMQFVDVLDLEVEEFKKVISGKADRQIAEDKVAGLLGVERSGKNRTEYVKAMMARLGVKSVYEVTNAGPSFTNDVTPTSAL